MLDLIAPHAGMIGLIFFVVVFSGIAFWVLSPSQKNTLESYKFLPLQEDGHE